ncbi:hypothetical protein [Deinococcus aquaticus]|uniref:hypothetical protein n=1 Tax=Deinococcus aquaticus TaxID=328692 RepID=UPI00361EC27F
MNARRESMQGLLSLLAVLGSSALNYGYTLLLGRLLDLPGYGAFAAFTSLFMLTAALPIAFQQATSRRAQGANTGAALRTGAWWALCRCWGHASGLRPCGWRPSRSRCPPWCCWAPGAARPSGTAAARRSAGAS